MTITCVLSSLLVDTVKYISPISDKKSNKHLILIRLTGVSWFFSCGIKMLPL